MKTNVTTTIDIEAIKVVKALGVSYAECLEFGILFKQAERLDENYPANLLSQKITALSQRLEAVCREGSEKNSAPVEK